MSDIVHEDIETLLGAYALDAVDPAEAVMVERHLAECPRCRAEVDAYLEIAGLMGSTVETVPDTVWDRIAAGLGEHAVGRPYAPEEILEATRREMRGAVVPIVPARERRDRRRLLAAAASVAAAVAVGVIAVLGAQVAHQDGRVGQLSSALSAKGEASAVQAALETPGHRLVTLASAQGAPLAQFVVLRSGQGYLVSAHMAVLPASETYQLWALISGEPISLGLLGTRPTVAAFTIANASAASKLEVTIEPADGVVVPDRAAIGSGAISV